MRGFRVEAPWTEDIVDELRAWQATPSVHPYTCGTDSRHVPLVPTTAGWVCTDCDYTQTWALSWVDRRRPL